ncbi:MAG: VCBS repeat-containing protein [Gemmatimonadetes bacterium]|nr:VCBS repeat-containing protein [Gemmatimonadota bacterium]
MRLLIVAALLTFSGCRLGDDPPLFVLRSADETGITFANRLQEDDSVYNPIAFDYIYNGGGVAVGDLNNDGRQDVYFSGNMVSSRLYLNRGELRFDDVTERAGVGTQAWATGTTLVDINQDGLLDIYVCVAGRVPDEQRANLLFVNQGVDASGTPRFVEQGKAYGVADTGYSTHAAFFDYDLDGDLDLYVLTNALEEFSRNTIRPKLVNGEAASTDRLYRNNGDGSFTNVSREAGILIEGFGLGMAVSDLNRDGWPDVYAANDFITNDLVWINNRDGTFTDRAPQYLKHQAHNAMGTDVADVNNDGLVDIVTLDMLPEDNLRQKLMLSGSNYDKFRMSLYYGYAPQYVRNTLQINNGPGPSGEPTFSDVGQLSGIHNTDWSWAALLADFDNDGLRDLFITNGYRRDVTNLDYIVYTTQETQSLADPARRRKELLQKMRELPEVKLPNYMYQNRGDLTFTDRSEDWGIKIPSFSNGAAYADLDNDGDLDLVVNNLDDEAFLFENRASELPGRHYLRVALRGPRGNLPGHGAKVVVHAGRGQQYHDHSPYRGYKSTVESPIHFGLGAATRVDSLEVFWPDGAYQRLTGVTADQMVTLDHRNATLRRPPQLRRAAPLFRTASAVGLAHRHEERELADFKISPALPHKLSNLGPGIAVGDVDGNGLDDVYVGADRGKPKELFLQTAQGRFAKRALPGDLDYEDMGALFFDAEGDGDLDLYVVSGGGYPDMDDTYQDRLYINDGRGGLVRDPRALPRETASGSSVVAADYDRDGDLDLFVGGRVLPGSYPSAGRSYLLRNDCGPGGPAKFTDVTQQVAPGLAEAGMVTAALWTDYDQDGQVDLLLAGEWMPLTFFHNERGRLVDASRSVGLGDTRGWWNSLAAGDFDNDGDVDYMAGNLGLNTRYQASPRQPVRVHAADFDQNGSVDPILSRYIGGESYAVASRDILIDQIIGMKGRFPRYAHYGNARLEETLSGDEREKATVLESVMFASSYLENLGRGKFAIRRLPNRAQLSPAFGMLTGDYNSDGNLDLLMVGNSYATDTQAGWEDASVGSVLLGNGRGQFRYLSGSESGFFVEGDAKGIAEIRRDGAPPLLLVTQNNDSLRTFTPSGPPSRVVKLDPADAYAMLTFKDGRVRREEFHYGSTYLSQSSRALSVPATVVSAVIYDSAGRRRSVGF